MANKTIPEMKGMGNEVIEIGRESRLAAIQALIPLGLKAVCEELQAEVLKLAGPRYKRGGLVGRWGSNGGSVYLGDQKVRVRVPRVRRKDSKEEIPLRSYRRLQDHGLIDAAALRQVIHGVSLKDYEAAALSVPETFGIKRNSVSKRWIRASGKKLRELQERSLKELDVIAMVLDGKTFGDHEVIVAIGITMTGEKVILGMIEASTERYEVCRDFLNGLMERGLSVAQDVFVVIDGGKGLRKAIEAVFGEKGVVQRCQWHKRENVVGYLGKERAPEWRRKLQAAYEAPDYKTAKSRLLALRSELKSLNMSAVKSLDEGFEETLTLHRLGLFAKLGVSLKTTNIVENVNWLLQRRTGRVTRWKTSDQRQRWVGTALLEIEPNLRKIRSHQHLPALRQAMRAARQNNQTTEVQKAA